MDLPDGIVTESRCLLGLNLNIKARKDRRKRGRERNGGDEIAGRYFIAQKTTYIIRTLMPYLAQNKNLKQSFTLMSKKY